MHQGLAEALLQGPDAEAQFPGGVRAAAEVRDAGHDPKRFGSHPFWDRHEPFRQPHDGRRGAQEGRAGMESRRPDARDPLGDLQRLDERMGRTPAMMYDSPARPRSMARMCPRAVSSTWAQQ